MASELDRILDEIDEVVSNYSVWKVCRSRNPERCKGENGCSFEPSQWAAGSELAATAIEDYLVGRGMVRADCSARAGRHLGIFKNGKS